MNDWKAIGTQIRRLREARGLSIAELAQSTGMTAQSIAALEFAGQGNRWPAECLERVAKVLGAVAMVHIEEAR